jgi:eukaryotic-like serine/threonine-protein kinase
MSTLSKNDFFIALKKSRLLTDEQLDVARHSTEGVETATEIANHLRKMKWLSAWQAQNLVVGKTRFEVGPYVALDFLGRGRMGSVYKVRQRETGEIVALKLMSDRISEDPRLVARFRRESRLISAARHPNIVAAIDAGHIDGRYFLVTDYVRGRDLQKWIQAEAKLPVGWACECIGQAALGLQHVHEVGLIHRDIKPSNLMVTGSGVSTVPRVKILDFGLGRFVEGTDEDGQLTRDGHTVGTVDFMAPEQIQNGRAADIRSDIYALGTTIFQALTRHLPFESDQLPERITSKLLKEAPRLETHRPDISSELSDLVAWMLKRTPDERPAIPQEVAEAIAPFTMTAKSRSRRSRSSRNGRAAAPRKTAKRGEAEEHAQSTERPKNWVRQKLDRSAKERRWWQSLTARLNFFRWFRRTRAKDVESL